MARPAIRVLGIYRVEATPTLFAEAMDLKYGDLALLSEDRAAAEDAVREELRSVALVEVNIDDADERFDVGDFGQPGSDQAPYDEAFLSPDGQQVIARGPLRQSGTSLRVAFFLHFFDPSKTLHTTYGDVPVWEPTPMPEHLERLIPYEPVD